MTNSEDTDEMLQHATFNQGLHSLLRQNQSSEKEIHCTIFLKIITNNPSLYIMDHPDLTVSNFMEFSIGPRRVCF